jgi:hydroxymethylpyrimidine/phosphomethylpyrimidine kinase
MTATALTIAGSDPSGGAGLQADLKTFHQHRVYGMSVVTLLTVQNTRAVSAVDIIRPDLVVAQLDAVLSDIAPTAAKTGALGNAAIIEAVADRLGPTRFPLIIDPVMVSKHGAPLMAPEAAKALISRLLPRAFLVTPNLAEAEQLAGMKADSIASMERAARLIASMGPRHVLVKGGHLAGEASDLLLADGHATLLPAGRVETPHTHGTGCVLSAAITARLARGEEVGAAARDAKEFVRLAIKTNPGLGGGFGPINMFADPRGDPTHAG